MVEEQQTEFQKEGSSVGHNEVSILELRKQKAGTKSAFTKARHSLLVSLTDKELKTDRIMHSVHRLSRENSVSSESELIGQDLQKQLKRVTIPTFSGDK